MKRKILSILTTLMIAIGIGAVIASPASAAGPSNAVSFWSNSTWSGTPMYYWTTPPNGCTEVNDPVDDEASSVALGRYAGPNPTTYVILYEHHGCTGAVIASAVNTNTNSRLLNCTRTYNPWNTNVSGCTWGDVSSFWFHD